MLPVRGAFRATCAEQKCSCSRGFSGNVCGAKMLPLKHTAWVDVTCGEKCPNLRERLPIPTDSIARTRKAAENASCKAETKSCQSERKVYENQREKLPEREKLPNRNSCPNAQSYQMAKAETRRKNLKEKVLWLPLSATRKDFT